VRFIYAFLGYSLILISGIFIFSFCMVQVSDEPQKLITFLLAILFFFAVGLAGFKLTRLGHRGRQEKRERQILQFAAQNRGRITPAELAMALPFSAEECQTVLETLCDQGIAQLQITDTGNLLYVFEGFLSETEKTTSKNPLDR